jgi:anti-anti-sigma factor
MNDGADGATTGHKPDIIQPDSRLIASCHTSQTGESTLTFGGDLDVVSADQAYRYVRDVIDTHRGPVLLDVAGLSFCDARGLGALIRMRRHAGQAGSCLHLVAPPRRLVTLMRITGLDQELPVHRGDRTGEVALACLA